MLKYDSTHGNFKGSINVIDDSTLEINGKKVNVVSKRYRFKIAFCFLQISEHAISLSTLTSFLFFLRDPAEIPWADLGADYVVESSGVFTTLGKAASHLKVRFSYKHTLLTS